ncbi:unnamed protein product, partial [Iphiclides podalirius]
MRGMMVPGKRGMAMGQDTEAVAVTVVVDGACTEAHIMALQTIEMKNGEGHQLMVNMRGAFVVLGHESQVLIVQDPGHHVVVHQIVTLMALQEEAVECLLQQGLFLK